MRTKHCCFAISLLTLLFVTMAGPAAAEVLIVEQYAEVELAVHAFCAGEDREVERQTLVFHDLVGAPGAVSRAMPSGCSIARAGAQLGLAVEPQALEGVFGVSNEFMGYGDVLADFRGHIVLQVDSPTEVTIQARGEYSNTFTKTRSDEMDPGTGESSKEGPSFLFSGPNVTVMMLNSDSDEQWTRTLQPGGIYTITMEAHQEIGCCIHLVGTPWPPPSPYGTVIRMGSFRMDFDTVVVENSTDSWGVLKARY